ncbi:HalOD1 output domain-containing protein [Natronosalvus caseinilyticus]|uniref:HalOD1 output domain-containing protein n=1 Tax=Natronosalvus caseinilyticus TaxID=2953747 RepID=UPI0028A6812C|nr:HalOD1 output domain-containing protein [Natronosalvus caseinilyticus]
MTQDKPRRTSQTREWYTPNQDRSLTEAVLDAIEDYKGEDLLRADFVLYEDIDADALNSLFRHDAPSRTTVTFGTDGVKVELWGGGGVEIRVTGRSVE